MRRIINKPACPRGAVLLVTVSYELDAGNKIALASLLAGSRISRSAARLYIYALRAQRKRPHLQVRVVSFTVTAAPRSVMA